MENGFAVGAVYLTDKEVKVTILEIGKYGAAEALICKNEDKESLAYDTNGDPITTLAKICGKLVKKISGYESR